MSQDISSLFNDIQNSFNKGYSSSNPQFKDLMRFEKGKDYEVRLLPYVPDPSNTIFNIRYHGFISASTQKYVEYIDPSIFDRANPIAKFSWDEGAKLKALKLDKDDKRMIRARALWPKDAWLVNCYVITDPTKPENEGTVKVIRMGKQLYDIVREHFDGEEKEEFGAKIFDVKKGHTFKIKVRENDAQFPTYTNSRFMAQKTIDLEKSVDEIHSECLDLTTLYPVKSYEELKEAISVHYLGESDNSFKKEKPNTQKDSKSSKKKEPEEDSGEDNSESDDDSSKKKASTKKIVTKKAKEPEQEDGDEDDIDVDALLEGIGDE